MKIIRNGVEIELTNEELRQAHDEYTNYCRIEDILDNIYDNYGILLDREKNEKLLNSIAERSEDILSKNDGYYERFWDSVGAAIEENKESIILAQKPLTPRQYFYVATGHNYPDYDNLDTMLDALERSDLQLWDYPIDEIDEALENNEFVILVEFPDGSKRVFEANEEMMQKYETIISDKQPSLTDIINNAEKKSGALQNHQNIKDKEPELNL